MAAISRAWSSAAIGACRPVPKGRSMTPSIQIAALERIGQPLREEGGPQMRHRHAGPVEHALGKPMVARGMAFGIAPRRDLRHVDDRLDLPVWRAASAKEVVAGIEARPDRIAEIGGVDPRRRMLDGVVIQQVADDDRRTQRAQSSGAGVVLRVHQWRATAWPARELLSPCSAGLAGGGGHQNRLIARARTLQQCNCTVRSRKNYRLG